MRLSLSVVASALAFIACSSGTSTGTGASGGTGSSGSTPVATADCTPRCTARAQQCGASSAQASDACSSVCASSTTAQLSCLETKTCQELNSNKSLDSICPKGDTGSSSGSSGSSSGSSGSSGGTKAGFGASCTCPGVSAGSDGLCSGTSAPCESRLSCIYESGSSGKGTCFAESCCTTTSACDKDKSLLKSCAAGTCTRTAIGWYCGQ